MSVSSSPASVPCFSLLAASSGDHENSDRIHGGAALLLASTTLARDTDLLPYCSRIFSSFGRLMPIGLTGPVRPVSMTTSMALATMPVTLGLRYLASYGMWSSNHCA